MDIWQLHIFCKVVEHQSFSKAGKIVHLSQPTVSSHIKDLEDHFECRLIDRLSRKALPTKAGELLYRHATKIVAMKSEAEAAMADFIGTVKGKLAIGGSTIPGGYILPKIIGQFRGQYPEVGMSLKIGDSEKITDEILAGTVELGVVGAAPVDRRLTREKLVSDEMRLVVPADHRWRNRNRIRLREIFEEPFILREHGSGTLKSIEASLSAAGHALEDLNAVAEMGSTEAVIQSIKSHVGVSILSEIAVSQSLAAGVLKALTVDGLDLKRFFFLVTARLRSTSPPARTFIEFLKSRISYE